jgi:UDP-glucose 4-epimerase
VLPECGWVIHSACASTPGSSALRPLAEVEDNLLPSLRFLHILQDYTQARLIYLSTGGALYGNPDPSFPLVPENLCAAPLSYYGAGKAALEQFIIAFCNQQQRPGIILRPANFYGPGQPCKPGFGIVPTILQRLRQNQPIQIWGDGETVRDYLYIEDFIDLCATLLTSPRLCAGAAIYNVGSQQGTSLNQLCGLLEEVTRIPLQREYHASRVVDVRRIVLDCRRIQADYGWRAGTDLSAGLRRTWEWFAAQAGVA